MALGVWFARALFERILSTPHTISGVTITPYGHSMESLLTHHFDSVRVSVNGNDIKIANPNLDVTLLGNRLVQLQTDSVIAYIQIPQESAPSKPSPTPQIEFPDNVHIPVDVQLDVKNAQVMLSDGKGWQAQNIHIKNHGEKAVSLRLKNATGDFLPEPTSAILNADFNGDKLKVVGTVKTKKDSVALDIEAPKKDLTTIKASTNLTIASPGNWIPTKLPEAVPELGKLTISANATVDIRKKRATYNANIRTRIGAFWPLLAENVSIELNGDQNNIEADVLLKNDEGGTIQLYGSFDKELNGFLTGRVNHMSALFGPQMMPLDMEIKLAELNNKKATVSVETRQGSLVDATIDFSDSLMITFVGDISPYEPWALDWTQGNLTLGARSKAYGTFDGHSLKILAKINSIINAYHMAADSLQVTLDLNKKGIDFSNGIIYTPKELFDFTGDVKWNDEHPHTSWKCTQRHGGHASAYIGIADTIFIDVDADKVVFSTIPFSDINLGRNIDGLVSGSWLQDFDNNIGEAEVSSRDPLTISAPN